MLLDLLGFLILYSTLEERITESNQRNLQESETDLLSQPIYILSESIVVSFYTSYLKKRTAIMIFVKFINSVGFLINSLGFWIMDF